MRHETQLFTKTQQVRLTNFGVLVDSDEDGMALAVRHGFVEGDAEDEQQEQFVIDASEFDDDDFSFEVSETAEFLQSNSSFEILSGEWNLHVCYVGFAHTPSKCD